MSGCRMPSRARAFSLVELLIVMAVIGIIAVISIPNYLHAQMKAKYVRSVSNLRVIEMALDSYYLDRKSFPRWATVSTEHIGFRDLTTPVAYLSNAKVFEDPFLEKHFAEIRPYYSITGNPLYTMTTYHLNRSANALSSEFPRTAWQLTGSGPDNSANYLGSVQTSAYELVFQPTNGLISKGNVVRSGGIEIPREFSILPY